MVAGVAASYTSTNFHPHIMWPCRFSTSVAALSRPVWDRLHQVVGRVRVLAQFRRVINLVLDDEFIFALVRPDVGNGPFHIVLERLPSMSLLRAVPLWWAAEILHIGPWALDCGPVPVLWNPRPPWGHLHPHPAHLVALRQYARQVAGVHPAPSPIVRYLLGESFPIITAFGHALTHNDVPAITGATTQLAGLGPGLTPSGDDFLAGVMLGLHLSNHATSAATCQLLYAIAAPCTTRLSQTFLQAASQGYADERWHTLLIALGETPTISWRRAAQAVFDFGSNSGLDMITGFLWQMARAAETVKRG